MNIIYYDNSIIVCIKPAGVISTDEEGGMPQLLREALGDENADIRAVHRLDQVVSGLMVYAQSNAAASELSRQIRCGEFHKSYLAVVHGVPEERKGRFEDILLRSKEKRKTFVINKLARGAQNAILDYELLGSNGERSLVAIELITGRTHQIRAQMAHFGCPLLGDGKYGSERFNKGYGEKGQALYSYKLRFEFPTDAGCLEYLRGREFCVRSVDFAEKYFGISELGSL